MARTEKCQLAAGAIVCLESIWTTCRYPSMTPVFEKGLKRLRCQRSGPRSGCESCRMATLSFHLPHKRGHSATNFLQGGRVPQAHSFLRIALASVYESFLLWRRNSHGTSTCCLPTAVFGTVTASLISCDESKQDHDHLSLAACRQSRP